MKMSMRKNYLKKVQLNKMKNHILKTSVTNFNYFKVDLNNYFVTFKNKHAIFIMKNVPLSMLNVMMHLFTICGYFQPNLFVYLLYLQNKILKIPYSFFCVIMITGNVYFILLVPTSLS